MTTQEILQGVHDWANGKIVYDISAAHPDGQGNPTPYADLTAALGTGGANIPEGLRKGGMSVKFIQSSDNKYVQYRLMATDWSVNESDWQGVDGEPVVDSKNLVESGGVAKLLYNISTNNSSNFNKGWYYALSQGVGGTAPVNMSANSGFACLRIGVKADTTIFLKTIGEANGRAYALTNTKRVILSVAPAWADYSSGITLKVEQDGYLYVNTTTAFLPNVSVVIFSNKTKIEQLQNELNTLTKEVISEVSLSGLFTGSTTSGRKVNLANSTYNSVIVYIPAGYTTFSYDGLVPGSIDGFSEYPKVGDYAEIRCTNNTTAKTITISNNENGWYILIDVTLASQPTPFTPNVYIPGTLVNLVKEEIDEVNERVDDLEAKIAVSKMYNIPADLKKSGLKILLIGNSYTGNMVEYLSALCSNIGNDVSDLAIYRIYQGSSGFTTWVNNYNNNANITCSKVVGDLDLQLPQGSTIIGDSVPFRDILSLIKWDIIFIQQVSTYATDYDTWLGTGAGGNLIEYVRILKKTNPQATIGYILPHSYKDDYSGNTEHSSLLRWEKIADASEKMKANYAIDLIIPYGTAVENLRSTTLNQDDFSTDGTHLATGLGMYVAACCCYQMLLAPRFGTTMIGNTLRYTSATHPVTDDNAEEAQEAALYACCDMFSNNPPDVSE